MTASRRVLALTPELVASAFPHAVADDEAAMPLLPDSTVDAMIDDALGRLGPADDLWLFAYGALMWKPDFPFVEQRLITIRGWHRRFCLWQWRYRGTRQNPGLMLTLDRGGACTGVLYRIAAPDVRAKTEAMLRRELRGDGYRTRWLSVPTDRGALRALAFVVNRTGARYAGKLPDDDVAAYLAAACGHSGPAAEYLREAAACCAALGIEDRMLMRMQALVAAEIRQGLGCVR